MVGLGESHVSNFSGYTSDHTSTTKLFMGVTFGSLILISLAGNILVCVAVYTNKKLRKKENLYFVSLAGADLLLSILVMPFGAVNEISSEWHFGNYCKYWMCLDICFVTASILHLAAISFDRYSHIHNPMTYEERMTITKIGAAIFGVWATSVAVAFLPLAFDTYFHRALVAQVSMAYDLNGTVLGTEVIRYQCEFNLDPLYAIVSSMASFYIPCILMILAYGKLYRYARSHSRAIRKQQEEVRMPLLVKPDESQAKNGVQNQAAVNAKPARMDGDQKARVTLGVITGVFLASWLPFFVANIVRSWCDESSALRVVCPPDWLFITLTWMGYANSAQNPIIYSIFNRDFRLAFRKILLCGRRPQVKNLAMIDQKQMNAKNKSLAVRRLSARRRSEAPPLIRKESPCLVFDFKNRTRSASIVAKLANGGSNDSNGYPFQRLPEPSPKQALEAQKSHTTLSNLSNFKLDQGSLNEGNYNDEMVWIPRQDDESGSRKSSVAYVYCWHTTLAVMCCVISIILV